MGRNLGVKLQQELENLDKDSHSQKLAMKALKSYVKDTDTTAIPIFLAQVSETKENYWEYTISLMMIAKSAGVNGSVVSEKCSPGPIFRIQFKFRRVEIPPNYNADHMGCIGGCDETLRQLTEICGTGSHTPSVTPVSGRVPTASSSSNVPRNHSRQMQSTCIHCRQTGNSLTECPSQNSRFRAACPQRTNSPSGEPSVPCTTCGAPCILRTASTASNNGGKFYSCQSRECKFFVWEDSMNESTRGRSGQAPHSTMTNSAPNASRRGRLDGAGVAGMGVMEQKLVVRPLYLQRESL